MADVLPTAGETVPAEPAPPPAPPALGWKKHVVAAFLLWHLVSVLVYILPYPPYFDDRTLKMPEVQEELTRMFSAMHQVAPIWKDPQETQTEVLKLVRVYMDVYFKARKPFEAYLDAVGSTQSWNMFGGTPPKYPRVFMVEIRPQGHTDFVPYKDFRWGTPDHDAADFRDFKAHEVLSIGGWDRQREWYAAWFAKLWNAEHPDQPAEQVHFYYLQQTTPPPEELRKTHDRHEKALQHFHWNVPKAAAP